MMPVGQSIPLTLVGLKLDGVTPFTIFKSKVSVWLGAPVNKMKMTFSALLIVVTPAALRVGAATADVGAKRNEPAMPPAICSRPRRLISGRRKYVA